MIRITCDPAIIRLILPMCAEQPTSASLSRRFCATHVLEAVAGPSSVQEITLTGIPADIERGVWSLDIETPCGCYMTNVFLDMCQPPAFASTHYPTDDTGPIIECCDPEEPAQ